MDAEKIKEGVRLLLEGMGEDPQREGLIETPERIARMYAELASGYAEDASEHLAVRFKAEGSGMVLEKDIYFYSMCEHHLLPFYGRAAVAYVPEGEVVGLTGLLGSGRSELARAIYGADKAQTGTLKVDGKDAKVNQPIDAMNMGMGLLPDDRKAEGIIADLSVRENIILAMQAKRGMFKQLSRAKQEEIADKYIDLLQIKTATRETPIRQLSGGNQQKAILARWLATDPDFLILDEPTRGIDVGTKTEIQKLIIQLAGEGKSIMFISSEIEEMLRTCNRLAVLRDGAKVGELDGELTQERVMAAIAGGASNE